MRVLALFLSLCLSCAVNAQGLSMKDASAGPPPANAPLFSPEQPLTAKERKGVRFGKEWAGNRDKPARGEEGATIFVFGSTLPTLVCAPLYVCDLALQESESVNDLNVGDSVRWKVTPAAQGAGEAVITHVLIKPTDAGLITNLVITTNKRTYIVKLVSREKDWMPRVAFDYPDDATAQWKAYRARLEDERAETQAMATAARVAPGEFDFNYAIFGDAPWRPTRVYSDGVKTYILFPPQVGSAELPALAELVDDTSFLGLASLFSGEAQRLVNYRFVDHRFEVDKVLERARLTAGVGDSATTVTITHMRAVGLLDAFVR
jgi:type IV secretion system protein VirB9